MDVEFTPEQIKQLAQVAGHCGKDVMQFVRDAALHAAREEERFLRAIEEGIEQADRGELIDHEKVVALFERKYGAQ